MQETQVTVNENNVTETKTTNYRGAMKRAMDFINSTKDFSFTPEGLGAHLNVPPMSAYRALKIATASGVVRVEKLQGEVKRRGPSKNVFVRA